MSRWLCGACHDFAVWVCMCTVQGRGIASCPTFLDDARWRQNLALTLQGACWPTRAIDVASTNDSAVNWSLALGIRDASTASHGLCMSGAKGDALRWRGSRDSVQQRLSQRCSGVAARKLERAVETGTGPHAKHRSLSLTIYASPLPSQPYISRVKESDRGRSGVAQQWRQQRPSSIPDIMLCSSLFTLFFVSNPSASIQLVTSKSTPQPIK